MSQLKLNYNPKIPDKLINLVNTYSRIKVIYGGRGGGKSETVARIFLWYALTAPIERPEKLLCLRQFATNLSQSVKPLVERIATEEGVSEFFTFHNNVITCNHNNSQFIFGGFQLNPDAVKSADNITRCWIEEADRITPDFIYKLKPSLRASKSELWVTFNPQLPDDFAFTEFVINPNRDVMAIELNYWDNPFFGEPLLSDMLIDYERDKELYQHVWCGKPLTVSKANIFADMVEIKDFAEPNIDDIENNRFYFGCDWGYNPDPTVLLKMFIKDGCLYILDEFYAKNVEIDDYEEHFNKIKHSKMFRIIADTNKPETISYLNKRGFQISKVKKPRSNEKHDAIFEQISLIRSKFKKIYISPNCKNSYREMMNFRRKIDRVNNNNILPIVENVCKHVPDAVRYGLSELLKQNKKRMYISY